jgi:hypothetical protein
MTMGSRINSRLPFGRRFRLLCSTAVALVMEMIIRRSLKLTDGEQHASDLTDKAIELDKQADQILANLPSAVYKGQTHRERERLIKKAAELRELARSLYEQVDASE